MRNLKRALSLTLASVMLLGMMVVGTSAAGFPDVDGEDNVEAIEVLQAVKVMVGDKDTGNFRPDSPVSRAEMAVVMANLLNLNYNYYATSCPFNDVPDWARGCVGACYANKIVSGRGEGLYDPNATVTAVEASSMLMRALGYFQYSNDYADGFQLSTVRMGTKIGIYDQVGADATAPMTRNQVAQMVLNALRTGMVEPDGKTINLTTPDGQVYTGKVNYVNITSNKSFASAIGRTTATSVGSQNDGYIVELGEKLYDGKLKLDDYRMDDFGRPSRRWEYDGKEVGNYVKKELLRETYTDKVTGRMLEELLTSPTIDDYKFVITVDGETEEKVLTEGDNSYFTKGNLIHSNTKAVGATDKGVLTEVFVDTDRYHEYVYIAVINTYLAKATSDYNTKKEEAYFNVYGVEDIGDKNGAILVKNTGDKNTQDKTSKTPYTERLTVENKDIAVADVKEDDLFLAHVAKGEIKELIAPEILSQKTIVNFKEGSYVTSDGAKTEYDDTALYDAEVLDQYDDKNLKNVTYNIILDEYGYLIGLELNEDPDQYVFITGTDGNFSNLKDKEADMAAIFTDGTMKTITVNVKDSDDGVKAFDKLGAIVNRWCTYTVDKNDVYTLKVVPLSINNTKGEQVSKIAQWATNIERPADGSASETIKIDKKHISLAGPGAVNNSFHKVYGNDDTIYISVETEVVKSKTKFATDDNPNTGNGFGAEKNYIYKGTPKDNQEALIINDVDSVTVGVKNANLEVKNVQAWDVGRGNGQDWTSYTLAVPKSEIYTLYNKDGRVIAAVVLGVDQGTDTKYAYFHSDKPVEEAYDDSKDEYTWRREAIVDGKIVELREVGSSLNKLGSKASNGNIQDGDWAEVKFDADGNVRSVKEIVVEGRHSSHASNALIFCTGTNTAGSDGKYPKFIDNFDSVEKSTEDNDVVVLFVDLTDKTHGKPKHSLSYKNGALWLDGRQIRGIDVSSDVNTVLCLSELVKGGTPGDPADVNAFDDVDDDFEKYAGLELAIDRLDSNFYGYVGVVIKDGLATSIILDDRWGTEIDQGSSKPGTNLEAEMHGDDLYIPSDDDTIPDKVDQFRTLEDTILNAYKDVESIDVSAFSEATGLGVAGEGTYTANLVFESGSKLTVRGKILVGSAKLNAENTEASEPELKDDGKLKDASGANEIDVSSQKVTISGNNIKIDTPIDISTALTGSNTIAGLGASGLKSGDDKVIVLKIVAPSKDVTKVSIETKSGDGNHKGAGALTVSAVKDGTENGYPFFYYVYSYVDDTDNNEWVKFSWDGEATWVTYNITN